MERFSHRSQKHRLHSTVHEHDFTKDATIDKDHTEYAVKCTKDNVTRLGSKCAMLSRTTASAFEDVMKLLAEILQGTKAGQGISEKAAQLAEDEVKKIKLRLATAKKQEEQQKRRQEHLANQIKKVSESVFSALQQMPSGFEAFFQDLVCIIVDFSKASLDGPSVRRKTPNEAVGSPNADLKIPTSMVDLKTIPESLILLVKSMQRELERSNPGNDTQTVVAKFTAYKTMLRNIENSLPKDDNATSSDESALATVVRDAISVVEAVVTGADGKVISTLQRRSWRRQMDSLRDDLLPFHATVTDSNDQDTTSGARSDEDEEDSCNSMAAAQYKVDMTRKQYAIAEKQADLNRQKLEETYERLMNYMIRLSAAERETIDYKTVIQLMKEGIAILSDIRHQWSELAQFFSAMVVEIRSMIDVHIVDFSKILKAVSDVKEVQPVYSSYLKKHVKENGKIILEKSAFLYSLSNAYLEISRLYVMDQLASLDGLSVIPAEARQSTLDRLIRDVKNATEHVQVLALARNRAFKSEVQNAARQL